MLTKRPNRSKRKLEKTSNSIRKENAAKRKFGLRLGNEFLRAIIQIVIRMILEGSI